MAARAGFTSGSVRPRSPDSPSDETASVENRLALCGRVVSHDRSYDPQIYRHKSTGTYLPDRASICRRGCAGWSNKCPAMCQSCSLFFANVSREILFFDIYTGPGPPELLWHDER